MSEAEPHPASLAAHDVNGLALPGNPAARGDAVAALPSRLSMERSGRLLVVLLAAIFVVTAGMLGGMTHRTLQRMQRIQERVEEAERVRSIAVDLERLVLDALAADEPLDAARLNQLRIRLEAAVTSGLEPAMVERMRRIAAMIGLAGEVRANQLLGAVELVRATVDAESAAEARMFAGLRRDTQREFSVAVGMLVVLTALVLLSYGVLRMQILEPLHALRGLLTELAHGDFNTLVDERAAQATSRRRHAFAAHNAGDRHPQDSQPSNADIHSRLRNLHTGNARHGLQGAPCDEPSKPRRETRARDLRYDRKGADRPSHRCPPARVLLEEGGMKRVD